MKTNCLANEHLLTRISMYLNTNEITSFFSCNKTIRQKLNPETNPVINLMFYFEVNKKFFQMEDFNENEGISYDDKSLLENSWKNKTNWRKYLIEMFQNFKKYPDKKVAEKVLDIFKIRIYLSDLRKENAVLEFKYSSIHQILSYDKNFKDNSTYNYYDNYINNNYMIGNGKEIKILREGAFFENELVNFRNIFSEFYSNIEYQNVLNLIIAYDFENLDKLFNKINRNEINNINKIIYFILWSNHCFIMYIEYIYETIKRFEDDNDEAKFLNEFTQKHSDYINSAALANSHFENVNIIINYLNKYLIEKRQENNENKIDTNNLEKFSLYQLYFNIFKKLVHQKLYKKVNYKTSLLLQKYFNDIFENKEEENNNNENLMVIEDLNKTNYTSKNSSEEEIIFADESMEEEDFQFNNEITKKDTIENVSYAFLDMTINKYNSNAINHSELKINEEFQENENIYINEFKGILEKKLNEEKSPSLIFEKIEKYLEFEGNSNKLSNISNSFKLINKTKKSMLDNSFKIMVPYIVSKLQNDFSSHIKYDNNTHERILLLNNIEIQKNINLNYDLSEFSQKKIMKIEGKVKEEINNIKSFLYEQNIKGYDIKKTFDLVNKYMDNNGIELVLLVKKMIYFYYKEMEKYEENNQKIVNILTNQKVAEISSSLNGIIN